MSEGVLIAAFGIVAVAIGGLYALIFQHISHCNAHHVEMGTMREAIRRNAAEIGDRDSGIRGELHAHSNVQTQHEMRIEMLERR